MKDTLIYDVQLPAVPPGQDIESQQLIIIVDNVIDGQLVVDKHTLVIGNVRVPQDSLVRLELRYIDDAGNLSVNAAVNEFVAKDTITPPDPSSFGVILVGEEDSENPTA